MTIEGIIIPGKRGRILGSFFRTDISNDENKRPVVIICHGFPGYDQLLDFAYMLQEHGYHVLSFEYSGSWGSDGDYSLSNIIEDTNTVINWVLHTSDKTIDRDQIYLLCHSLGGFAGVNVFSRRNILPAAVFISPANFVDICEEAERNPETKQATLKELQDFCLPLNGVTPEKLIAEAKQNDVIFRFENVAKWIGIRPVLVVKGTQDVITPAPICADVLINIVKQIPGSRCEVEMYDAPHDYMNVRTVLRKRVLKFFDSISMQESDTL